jgi:uncharacterized membrane protein YraQ (UPF0718 family)
MISREEWKPLSLIVLVFLGCYFLPVGSERFDGAILESLQLAKWYAQEHVILCLVPAFFIAGAIAVFVRQDAVMKYLGPRARRVLAYGVASVSGSVLAVCSCTVLPLFAGIYKRGAGLGPATTFLYSGPAINVLAIILTARILGLELGVARAVGAIGFSILVGLLMHVFFRREEMEKAEAALRQAAPETGKPLRQNIIYFATMTGILVFANWASPGGATGLWHELHSWRWIITGALAAFLALILMRWFGLAWLRGTIAAALVAVAAVLVPGRPLVPFATGVLALAVLTSTQEGELADWFDASWGFAKQILPLLFFGVLIAGALLGRPGGEGLIPSTWISRAVGGNSLTANLFASIAGAFMYFATLTEVPILQGLIGNGMGKGPALALLLAGPALSLPNMLVIRSVMGTQKTSIYVLLVVVMATASGIIYGALFS